MCTPMGPNTTRLLKRMGLEYPGSRGFRNRSGLEVLRGLMECSGDSRKKGLLKTWLGILIALF